MGEPMNLKVHSGGIMVVMWAKRAGRWGRGRVSTRKATLVASYGDGGGGGGGQGGGGGHGVVERAASLIWEEDDVEGVENWRVFQDLGL